MNRRFRSPVWILASLLVASACNRDVPTAPDATWEATEAPKLGFGLVDPNGLLAHYPLDGSPNDASGNGWDGTILGATPAQDRFGDPTGAFYFDGGGYIRVSDFDVALSDFTVAVWVEADDVPAWYRMPYAIHAGGSAINLGDQAIIMSYTSNGMIAGHYTTQAGLNVAGPQFLQLDPGQWSCLVFTRDGNTLRLFQDGEEKTSLVDNLGAFSMTGGFFEIGAPNFWRGGWTENGRGDAKWRGHIDDVRLYDRAWSPAEVSSYCQRPPTAAAGGPYSAVEGSPIQLDGSGSSDPDGDALSYNWSFSDGGSAVGIDPLHTFADDGVYDVELLVSDGSLAGTEATTAAVVNAPPVIEGISIPLEPTAVSEGVSVEASFLDPGTLDTHTATIEWGDGMSSDANITQGAGGGSLSAVHSYQEPGVYVLTATVADDDGGLDSEASDFVVVYDPSAGFVTGGGWIESPLGSLVADPQAAGKATFGFVAKYQKGAQTPSGNVRFVFHFADFDFQSESYDWLVVNAGGRRAQFKGTGTINGAGEYRFMIWAVDDSEDAFRIRIWEELAGVEHDIYDNGIEQVIEQGSIRIHAN